MLANRDRPSSLSPTLCGINVHWPGSEAAAVCTFRIAGSRPSTRPPLPSCWNPFRPRVGNDSALISPVRVQSAWHFGRPTSLGSPRRTCQWCRPPNIGGDEERGAKACSTTLVKGAALDGTEMVARARSLKAAASPNRNAELCDTKHFRTARLDKSNLAMRRALLADRSVRARYLGILRSPLLVGGSALCPPVGHGHVTRSRPWN